jgi:hypothetical protein
MNETSPAAPMDGQSIEADRAKQAADHDAHVSSGAGRMPTPEEEAAAEAAANDVDLAEVAKHEREMLETGANVKGEGEVP